MTVQPILKRELTAAARRGNESISRSVFATALLVGTLRHIHGLVLLGRGTRHHHPDDADRPAIVLPGAGFAYDRDLRCSRAVSRCVAVEKERRTLEFLLATSLTAARSSWGSSRHGWSSFLGTLAAGLPVMLLLHRLGGIDGWLILLAYAGIVSTGFFLAAMSIMGVHGGSRQPPGDGLRNAGHVFLALDSLYRGIHLAPVRAPAAGLDLDRERVVPDQ